jgi:GlpG protein
MRHGSRTQFAIAIVGGALSNVAQFELTLSPSFAGFSGVVYALLGFLWMRGKHDPRAGYRLSQGAITFMLVWLGFGFIGGATLQMPNYCQLFGLLVGLAWGRASARLSRR